MAVQLAVADVLGGSESQTPMVRGTSAPPHRKPQLTGAVLAASIAEAAGAIGGWMVDRALAGYTTTVLTPDAGDTRALEILGAKAMEYTYERVFSEWFVDLGVLVVSAQLYLADPQVRAVVDARRNTDPEHTYLCGTLPGTGFTVVEHQPISLAAQAFKRHACVAAGVCATAMSGTETLWSDRRKC